MSNKAKDFNLHKLFLKALSNETRLLVLETLRTGPKCVNEICEDLCFEESRISHNLKCLCNCGFVEVERKGKKRIYKINEETIAPLFKAIDKHVVEYGQKLAACETLADVKALAKGEAQQT